MLWTVLRTAFSQWSKHRTARLGAALAYYSVFSLGPLLLIVVAVAGLFFGDDAVRGSLSSQFQSLLGEQGGQAIEAMLVGASSKSTGTIAAIIGIVLVLVSAIGVVAQLKDAMNTIWNVEEPVSGGIWSYLRTYVISFAGILALGLLLTVALVVSAGLAAISDAIGGAAAQENAVWQVVNFVVSLAVLVALFAMLFKWFPDTRLAWRDVILGAVVTAILFNVGKFVIGWYVGRQALDSTYGAAASLIVLLLWVYYSAQIVLFGAELTHAYASRQGSRQGQDVDRPSPNKQ